MRSVLNEALDYAEFGFAVFPVGSDCRQPLIASANKGEGGVHMATKDAETIRKWFARPCNLAIACGRESGVIVIDIDVKTVDGMASAAKLDLRPTWRASTPSGGQHWYFRHPVTRQVRNRVGFLPGLDVRTTGGSVAAPPSAKPNGTYTWMVAPWEAELNPLTRSVLELIDPPLPPPRPMPKGADHRYGQAALNREAKEVATTKAGRNQRLFVAAANMGALVGAGVLRRDAAEVALEAAALECGLTKEDGLRSVRGTIQSGLQRGEANPRRISDISSRLRSQQQSQQTRRPA